MRAGLGHPARLGAHKTMLSNIKKPVNGHGQRKQDKDEVCPT